jgi:hypothetical protein
VPGEDDLYGAFSLLGGGSTALNLTPILLDGVPYRGLEISGQMMLNDVYRTLPAVILSIQDHLDRWNIVRPKEVASLTIPYTSFWGREGKFAADRDARHPAVLSHTGMQNDRLMSYDELHVDF